MSNAKRSPEALLRRLEQARALHRVLEKRARVSEERLGRLHGFATGLLSRGDLTSRESLIAENFLALLSGEDEIRRPMFPIGAPGP